MEKKNVHETVYEEDWQGGNPNPVRTLRPFNNVKTTEKKKESRKRVNKKIVNRIQIYKSMSI